MWGLPPDRHGIEQWEVLQRILAARSEARPCANRGVSVDNFGCYHRNCSMQSSGHTTAHGEESGALPNHKIMTLRKSVDDHRYPRTICAGLDYGRCTVVRYLQMQLVLQGVTSELRSSLRYNHIMLAFLTILGHRRVGNGIYYLNGSIYAETRATHRCHYYSILRTY